MLQGAEKCRDVDYVGRPGQVAHIVELVVNFYASRCIVDVYIHHLLGPQAAHILSSFVGRVPMPAIEQKAHILAYGLAQFLHLLHSVDKLVLLARPQRFRRDVFQAQPHPFIGEHCRGRPQPLNVKGEVLLVRQLVRGRHDPSRRPPHPQRRRNLCQLRQLRQARLVCGLLPAKINGKPPRRQAHALALGQRESLFLAHGRDFANVKMIPSKPVPRSQIKPICEVFYACADSSRR